MRLKKSTLWIGGVAIAALVAVIVLITSGAGGADVATAPVKIGPAEYAAEYQGADHLLIDVRTPEEFAAGYIDGAVNIPVDVIGQSLNRIPTDQPVVLYCRSGNRSAQAAEILRQAGYTQVIDLGGIIDWEAQGYQVTR
jgi:rhodanese-related sulfurtransferase